MAVTNIRRQQNTAQEVPQVTSRTPYRGLSGVNENTANNLGNYQQGYKPSEKVQQAQKNTEEVMSRKPGEYQGKYDEQLDELLQQITNPQELKYSFDGDELFKSYADEYTQRGKQASLDTMGQAAALTGGYGNSYAQQAANQQYQQYLLGLYDRGLDLYDRAYARSKDQQAQAGDTFNNLMSMDSRDYGRYQDAVANWQNERDFAAGREDAAGQADYQQYQDMLTYYTGLAEIENQAWNTEEERAEAIREYNQDFAEKVRQFDETMNWNKEESYRDFYENQRQFDESLNWDKEESNRDYLENQRQFNESLDWDKEESTRNFWEDVREYDTSLDWDKEESNRELAYNYVTAILANGGTPSQELLDAAWLTAADAEQLRTQIEAGGSGGSGGNKVKAEETGNTPVSPVSLWEYFPTSQEEAEATDLEETDKTKGNQRKVQYK